MGLLLETTLPGSRALGQVTHLCLIDNVCLGPQGDGVTSGLACLQLSGLVSKWETMVSPD